MIDRLIDGIKDSMFRPINKSASAILGVFSIVWGFWLANPFWSVFSSEEVFEIMRILPETAWGTLAMALGVAILMGMKGSRFSLLKWAVRAGFYFWLFVAIASLVGDWASPVGPTMLMITSYMGYVALNLSINTSYFIESDRS